MDKYISQNFLDFLEAMTEAFHYIERGADYFSVKVGAVEVKMDAIRRKVLLDDENKNG